ncbi:MAG: outer membrane protein assembly factor BamE [Kordiimonadaceae bacterium]|nr:outer membrane protein assembly factor BamE [Kordiimonadaceae bacterium]
MTNITAKTVRKNISLSLCIVAVLATTACGNARATRGYIFDEALADAILAGVDNRRSVQSTLGSPSVTATFSDDTWYYVSTTVRVRPVFWPDAKKHRVLAISFSDSGVVENVDNFDLSDMRTINPVADKTPTRGRELSLFQKIFGNVGRFSGQGQGPNGSQGGTNTPNG